MFFKKKPTRDMALDKVRIEIISLSKIDNNIKKLVSSFQKNEIDEETLIAETIKYFKDRLKEEHRREVW